MSPNPYCSNAGSTTVSHMPHEQHGGLSRRSSHAHRYRRGIRKAWCRLLRGLAGGMMVGEAALGGGGLTSSLECVEQSDRQRRQTGGMVFKSGLIGRRCRVMEKVCFWVQVVEGESQGRSASAHCKTSPLKSSLSPRDQAERLALAELFQVQLPPLRCFSSRSTQHHSIYQTVLTILSLLPSLMRRFLHHMARSLLPRLLLAYQFGNGQSNLCCCLRNDAYGKYHRCKFQLIHVPEMLVHCSLILL